MKYLIYIVTIIILVGINFGVFPSFRLFGVIPNLLLIFLVFVALSRGTEETFFVAFLSGLFLDFYSGVFIGGFTLSFVILALLLTFISYTVMLHELDWKYIGIIIVTATAFINIAIFLYELFVVKVGWGAVTIPFNGIMRSILPIVVYNIVLAYPLYEGFLLINKLIKFTEPQNRRLH